MSKKERILNNLTLDDEIKEVERELGQRRAVYPKLIAAAKLNKDTANRQYVILEKVLKRLTIQKANQDAGLLNLFDNTTNQTNDNRIPIEERP